jgi:hypothetical protein
VSKSELLRALRDRGVRLNAHAEALFEDGRFTTLGSARVVGIAAVSVAELGLVAGATYAQLVARALDAGLTECPLELGPHLRLQFLDQADSTDGLALTHGRAPPGSVTVASLPLDDSDDAPKGFYVRRADGAAWLRGYRASADHVWSPHDVLVFARAAAP